MSPAEIAGLLDERFRLLTGGRRTAVERHQTLRATVDWSYALLSGTERLVFDRLAVFAGSFDATSAMAVDTGEGVERWDVLDALAGLVDKSMIVPEDGPEGSTRYQLLETLRQYARERLDACGETDAWRRTHARHFATVAAEIGTGLMGPDEVRWRQRLTVDLDNLRSAVSWGLDSAEAPDQRVAVATIAVLAYEVQDRPNGIGTWAEQAVEAAQSAPAGHHDAVLGAASWAAQIRGDIQACVRYAEEALAAGYPPDSPAPGAAAAMLATGYMYLGRREEAEAALSAAIDALDRRSMHPYYMAQLRMSRVGTGMLVDDPAAEIDEARAALRLAEEAGSLTLLSYTSFAVGWSLRYLDPSGAMAAYDRCVALSRQLRSGFLLPLGLAFGAAIRAKQGLVPDALADMLAALEKSALDSDWPFIASELDSAVDMFSALGEWRTAAVISAVIETPSLVTIRYPTISQLGPGLDVRTELLARVRRELGDEAYEHAERVGRSMSREDALAFCLDQIRNCLEAIG